MWALKSRASQVSSHVTLLRIHFELELKIWISCFLYRLRRTSGQKRRWRKMKMKGRIKVSYNTFHNDWRLKKLFTQHLTDDNKDDFQFSINSYNRVDVVLLGESVSKQGQSLFITWIAKNYFHHKKKAKLIFTSTFLKGGGGMNEIRNLQ